MSGNKTVETTIMIAGSGGQGILFLGKLICQTAMLEGKQVTWFPSYGAEMRGGTANCTIVISDDLIGSPVVKHPGLMVVLNSASIKRFLSRIRAGGSLIYDSSLITNGVSREDISILPVPSSGLAGELGNPRLSNMVLLGAFLHYSGLFRMETVSSAVHMTVSKRKSDLVQVNLLAIEKGSDFAAHQKSHRS